MNKRNRAHPAACPVDDGGGFAPFRVEMSGRLREVPRTRQPITQVKFDLSAEPTPTK
jgi:hypothetical protein